MSGFTILTKLSINMTTVTVTKNMCDCPYYCEISENGSNSLLVTVTVTFWVTLLVTELFLLFLITATVGNVVTFFWCEEKDNVTLTFTVSGINGTRLYSKIGFIGLGNMGGHMAKNLLKKGYGLTVYDLNKSTMTNLIEAGAGCASNVAGVSKEADVIISMLPSNQHVLDVYTSENGVLSTVQKNVLLIDSSTVDPSVSQLIASQARERNLRFIDSPVSGGVNAAKDGTLTFMVGGTKMDFNDAKPILGALGSRIVHCGDVGMGQAAKLCNNMLLAISMIGTAEAFNLGQKLGLDAKILANVVNSSTGRCWSSDLYNPVPGILPNVPSSKNYEGGFGTTLMAKDLGLVQSAASRTQALIPLGSLAHQIYTAVINQGFSNKDFSVIYQFLKGKN